jgi:hypothetical protein
MEVKEPLAQLSPEKKIYRTLDLVPFKIRDYLV